MNDGSSSSSIRKIEIDNESTKKLCMICLDEKPISDIFRGTITCTHFYCTHCTIRYVSTKIKENTSEIKCPDLECTRSIEPNMFRDLIPKDLFDRWEKILCDKVYCPGFEDRSAVLMDDGSNAKVTKTESKEINSDVEDAMLVDMAKINQWKRCPSCKFYIERVYGCSHITCRCHYRFCYDCGLPWHYDHECTT